MTSETNSSPPAQVRTAPAPLLLIPVARERKIKLRCIATGKAGGGSEKSGGESAAEFASESTRGKPATSPSSNPATSPGSKTSAASSPTQPALAANTPASSLLSPTSKTNDRRPKDLGVTSDKTQSVLGKFKELEKKSPAASSPKEDVASKANKSKESSDKAAAAVKSEENEKLKKVLKEKEEKLKLLEKQVAKLEQENKQVSSDAKKASKEANTSSKNQKDEMEKALQNLKSQLEEYEARCERLATDNKSLSVKVELQRQEMEKKLQEASEPLAESSSSAELQLEEDLEIAEKELEEVKDENRELQSQLMELKNEMDEMYDSFRENEHDEFRELQKELDMTAKNCRILQFKLRKCERRNEQIEEDRVHYEEKLRQLQDQFESQDAKDHIRVLEEELRVAKEVSVRLHDELDIVEDKRGKAVEENRHLTELLEHTDKRQFRLEMEIDKLRDVVSDLKLQLKEAKGSNNNNSTSPDRKIPSMTIIGRQGSKEHDASALMKDLYDAVERENDLRDQLKFTEEEAKMMRRRVSETEDENENLRHQLHKMSQKASKSKKKEKETQRELEEERRGHRGQRVPTVSIQSSFDSQFSDCSDVTSPAVDGDVILVVGDADVINNEEMIPVSQRKDSTDEDLMNAMQMRVQLEMVEQELLTSHKKLDDLDLENENLQAEVKFLQGRLEEKEAESRDLPETLTPNAFYEDKLKELNTELDDLRWKLIEKDREMERLQVLEEMNSREQERKGDKLKRSKSSDTESATSELRRQLEHADSVTSALKRQLAQAQDEIADLKTRVEESSGGKTEKGGKSEPQSDDKATTAQPPSSSLTTSTTDLPTSPADETTKSRSLHPTTSQTDEDKLRPLGGEESDKPRPSVHANDAVLQNKELRVTVSRLEAESRAQADTIRVLTDSLHRLSRDTTSAATSPTSPGVRSLLSPRLTPTQPLSVAVQETTSGSDVTNKSIVTTPTCTSKSSSGGKDKENKEVRFDISPEENQQNNNKQTTKTETESKTLKTETKTQKTSESSSTTPKSQGQGHKLTRQDAEDKLTSSDLFDPDTLTSQKDSSSSSQSQNKSSSSANGKTPASDRKLTDNLTEAELGKLTLAERADREILMAEQKLKESQGGKMSPPGGDVGGGGGELDLLSHYADQRSKVNVTGTESRVELMEKVLDMDDEISDLLKDLRKKEEERKDLEREVIGLREQMVEVKEDSQRLESELLQELDMLHDKNSVMSNLLDIINERAEAAEEELEKRIQGEHSSSPSRSASNVSQVSALSDTSIGSDEVFAGQHKDGIIHRDWEAKLKVRIESLERLLAEERQKVSTGEKKLLLAGIDSLSPSVTDDVKLRMREKELLQEELLKSQRHLHIATDQIQGMKERISILEEELERQKKDYQELYEEVGKKSSSGGKPVMSSSIEDGDKTPENCVEDMPFLAKKISVVEAPKFKGQTSDVILNNNDVTALKEAAELKTLEAELASYKDKARKLELKVEEINDIWKCKSSASDKERDELEKQLHEKLRQADVLEDTITTLRRELLAKDKILAEDEIAIRERDQAVARKADMVKQHESEQQSLEKEHQTLRTAVDQTAAEVRSLGDTVRVRDERIREKDEIIARLNVEITRRERSEAALGHQIDDLEVKIKEGEAIVDVLRHQLSISTEGAGPVQIGEEGERLRSELNRTRAELEQSLADRKVVKENLAASQSQLETAMYSWDMERNALQRDVNVMEEKVRMYEVYNRLPRDETIDTLKLEAQDYFREKEGLLCEVSSLRMKSEARERSHAEEMARLQGELSEKLRLLKAEVDNNSQMNTELDRLRRQAEMAYRLQQEERILRAEHMAMKVRYETRIDKINKENNKMLSALDKLQRERDMDKDIIERIQEKFSLLKDKYTEELLRSEDDKANLDRQMKEIDESRVLTGQLSRQLTEVKEQCLDQERLRSELITRFATDRSAWEIARAGLISQVNQLEEQVQLTSRQQSRSKDIQVNMGLAWDKERREQRRLLEEAHTLALDLQEQLRARDEAFAHERKELLRQMEVDRQNWARERRDTERKLTELESCQRKVTALQKQLKESQERSEREAEAGRNERTELLRQLAEGKHGQQRDRQKVEEVLAGLVKLRDLASVLQAQNSVDTVATGREEKPPDKQVSNTELVTFVTEAMCQISAAADELSKYTNNAVSGDSALNQTMNSSVNTTTSETSDQFKLPGGGDVFMVADVTTKGTTTTSRIEEHVNHLTRKVKVDDNRDVTSTRALHTYVGSTQEPGSAGSQSNSSLPSVEATATKQASSVSSKPPVVLRPNDPINSGRFDRPPSYTSGTRSAHTSRATTPETPDFLPDSVSTLKHPSPKPPTFVIPNYSPLKAHMKKAEQKKSLMAAMSQDEAASQRAQRAPALGSKSYSVDQAAHADPGHNRSKSFSFSPDGNPAHPGSANHYSSLTAVGISRSRDSSPMDSGCSPRTARRLFFQEPNLFPPNRFPLDRATMAPTIDHEFTACSREASPAPPEYYHHPLPQPIVNIIHDVEENENKTKTPTQPNSSSQHHPPQPSHENSQHPSTSQSATNPNLLSPKSAAKGSPSLARSKSTDIGELQAATSPPAQKSRKEKQKLFFKKSKSVDSSVPSAVNPTGAAPAPTPTMRPWEFFAAVKGKLRPIFKRNKSSSSAENKQTSSVRAPSPLFIQTDVPVTCANFGAQGSTPLPVPVPHVDIEKIGPSFDGDEREVISQAGASERSRVGEKGQSSEHWRAKSEDPRTPSSAQLGNMWKFHETNL